ncbi:hypothetical protein BpHYR1_049658 [Brachionus plicatilis]|uniref:Uncharacterized protein n=1 Tax=Brachionus plicatilis TaxID=10195 RepID=A0A3M7R693_BRAPC|nr:hypothetical protein BpHYR1_049658 [Brachionus plicatilis]
MYKKLHFAINAWCPQPIVIFLIKEKKLHKIKFQSRRASIVQDIYRNKFQQSNNIINCNRQKKPFDKILVFNLFEKNVDWKINSLFIYLQFKEKIRNCERQQFYNGFWYLISILNQISKLKLCTDKQINK